MKTKDIARYAEESGANVEKDAEGNTVVETKRGRMIITAREDEEIHSATLATIFKWLSLLIGIALVVYLFW